MATALQRPWATDMARRWRSYVSCLLLTHGHRCVVTMGYEYDEPLVLMSIMPAFDPWPTYAAAMGYEYDEPLALICIMPAINSWHRCAAATGYG